MFNLNLDPCWIFIPNILVYHISYFILFIPHNFPHSSSKEKRAMYMIPMLQPPVRLRVSGICQRPPSEIHSQGGI